MRRYRTGAFLGDPGGRVGVMSLSGLSWLRFGKIRDGLVLHLHMYRGMSHSLQNIFCVEKCSVRPLSSKQIQSMQSMHIFCACQRSNGASDFDSGKRCHMMANAAGNVLS